jgi:exodeoxyribonuclease VII large subunit
MKTSLEGASPLSVLSRGYCVAEKNGTIVRSTEGIAPGDRMKLLFYDGSSLVSVERVDHDGNI